uniref:peptidase inhibitor 16-like n=1 Tax=Styela clava TaxID=7725 RepID=UPI0019393132|nr:peptidase inhibitor 16-like [Styela clava]
MEIFSLRGISIFLCFCVGAQAGEPIPLTQYQKDSIVNQLNDYRRQQGASDMYLVSWDNELAGGAADQAALCKFGYSAYAGMGYGETLAVIKKPTDVDDHLMSALSVWYDEINNMEEDGSCYRCGHYKQLVFAPTYKVGCGIATCPSDEKNIVCQFRQGLIAGIPTFSKGPACSECPYYATCHDKLCKLPW